MLEKSLESLDSPLWSMLMNRYTQKHDNYYYHLQQLLMNSLMSLHEHQSHLQVDFLADQGTFPPLDLETLMVLDH